MNHKKLSLLIIPFLLVSIVSALDLSDYPDMFIEDSQFNGFFVVADNAPADDVIGVSDIAMSIQYRGETTSTGTTINKIDVGATRLVSEIGNPNAQNLILVGRPGRDSYNGNLLIDKFYSGHPSGGLIKLIQNGNYYVLIVTGDTTQNVREATTVLANYKDYNFDGYEFSINAEPDPGPIHIIQYDIKDTLMEGEIKTYTVNNLDYEITLSVVTDQYPRQVKFNINGETLPSLEYGELRQIVDGSFIQVIEIIPNGVGDITEDLVTFVFKGTVWKGCTDSDGGKNYYEKGYADGVVNGRGTYHYDQCVSLGKVNGVPNWINVYECSGSNCKLNEGYCEPTKTNTITYDCPNGCRDGACIKEEQRCKDSDGGLNYYVKGKADALLSNGFRESGTDSCHDSFVLEEQYCKNGYVEEVEYQCPNGCREGACVKEEPKCTDSDGGKNYYVKGYVEMKNDPSFGINGRKYDQCWNDGKHLQEYVCENGVYKGDHSYLCPNGCRDGACIIKECPEIAILCTEGYVQESYIGEGGCTKWKCVPIKEGIYVKLNQKFELREMQSAKVTNYKNMKVILNSIVKECGYATTTTTSDSGTTSSGGGYGCRLIGAKVAVEMPTSCKVSSGTEECATTGTDFLIKRGETRNVFGTELSLSSLNPEQGVFVVSKKVEQDYVDVKITPESQEIYYGEGAKYSITIQDKHPPTVCTAACPSPGPCPPCEFPTYTYFIKIRNLPFNKRYEKQVTLSAGETITTYLTVTPFVVIEEKVEVEETASTPVEVTGRATASSSGGIGAIAKKVAQAAQPEEAVSATAISESVEEAVEEPVPIRESIEEEVLVRVPNLYRHYSFSVEVQQKQDPRVRDTAYAKLVIKPRIKPPEFPTEEITIKLYKGWNLISLPGKLIRFAEDGCTSKRKLLGFVYLKEEQKYVSLQEAQRILGNEFKEYLAKNSFWIYSYDDCSLSAKLDLEVSYSGINMYKGWNLVPITEDMVGGYLGEILGDCDIEKIYKWEAPNQEWNKISNDYVFSGSETSYGFIAKTSDYCSLGGVSILAPPAMPE